MNPQILTLTIGVAAMSPSALAESPVEIPPAAPAGKEWKLVWFDEFDGAKLDESKWNRLGDSKRRDGFWIKDDAFVNGKGQLILRTRKIISKSDRSISTARIDKRNHAEES